MKTPQDPSHSLHTICNHPLQQLKRFAFGALLMLIWVAAHPWNFWEDLSISLWESLAPIGIDVAMTPVTFDMMLMVDPSEGDTLYTRKFAVEYQLKDLSWHAIDLTKLDFHQFRIPALLFIEWSQYPVPKEAYLFALCRELNRKVGPIQAFKLSLEPASVDDQKLGLNSSHLCPTRGSEL